MNVTSELDAVVRLVEVGETDGVRFYAQTLARDLPAPIDEVWEALTSAARIPRWFLPVSGELRLGGHYQFEGNAGGEILQCAPPADRSASFSVSWGMGGDPAIVSVRLNGAEDGTRLELESVIAAESLPPGMWEQYGPGATGIGWEQALVGLGLHLVGDESITPEQGEAWQLSAEGRDFARGSADAWAKAHSAAGADPEQARSAADACYGFYTGEGG